MSPCFLSGHSIHFYAVAHEKCCCVGVHKIFAGSNIYGNIAHNWLTSPIVTQLYELVCTVYDPATVVYNNPGIYWSALWATLPLGEVDCKPQAMVDNVIGQALHSGAVVIKYQHGINGLMQDYSISNALAKMEILLYYSQPSTSSATAFFLWLLLVKNISDVLIASVILCIKMCCIHQK